MENEDMAFKTGRCSLNGERIRPTMHLVMLGLCSMLNYHFLGSFVRAGLIRSSWLERTILVTVAGWLGLTCFYASYHLVSFLFSMAVRVKGSQVPRNFESTPPVAILYPCMNDLRERSLETCMAQNYPDYAVFVLDDSTSSGEQHRVEAYRRRNCDRLSVIRRGSREGDR